MSLWKNPTDQILRVRLIDDEGRERVHVFEPGETKSIDAADHCVRDVKAGVTVGPGARLERVPDEVATRAPAAGASVIMTVNVSDAADVREALRQAQAALQSADAAADARWAKALEFGDVDGDALVHDRRRFPLPTAILRHMERQDARIAELLVELATLRAADAAPKASAEAPSDSITPAPDATPTTGDAEPSAETPPPAAETNEASGETNEASSESVPAAAETTPALPRNRRRA